MNIDTSEGGEARTSRSASPSRSPCLSPRRAPRSRHMDPLHHQSNRRSHNNKKKKTRTRRSNNRRSNTSRNTRGTARNHSPAPNNISRATSSPASSPSRSPSSSRRNTSRGRNKHRNNNNNNKRTATTTNTRTTAGTGSATGTATAAKKKKPKKKKIPSFTGSKWRKKMLFESKHKTKKSKHKRVGEKLKSMFLRDEKYWRQFFEEVCSPANRFPLPPQPPVLLSNGSTNNNASIISLPISDVSEYCSKYDQEMHDPPERLPEMTDDFYIYEFALLNDLDYVKNRKQSHHQYHRHQMSKNTPISPYLPLYESPANDNLYPNVNDSGTGFAFPSVDDANHNHHTLNTNHLHYDQHQHPHQREHQHQHPHQHQHRQQRAQPPQPQQHRHQHQQHSPVSDDTTTTSSQSPISDEHNGHANANMNMNMNMHGMHGANNDDRDPYHNNNHSDEDFVVGAEEEDMHGHNNNSGEDARFTIIEYPDQAFDTSQLRRRRETIDPTLYTYIQTRNNLQNMNNSLHANTHNHNLDENDNDNDMDTNTSANANMSMNMDINALQDMYSNHNNQSSNGSIVSGSDLRKSSYNTNASSNTENNNNNNSNGVHSYDNTMISVCFKEWLEEPNANDDDNNNSGSENNSEFLLLSDADDEKQHQTNQGRKYDRHRHRNSSNVSRTESVSSNNSHRHRHSIKRYQRTHTHHKKHQSTNSITASANSGGTPVTNTNTDTNVNTSVNANAANLNLTINTNTSTIFNTGSANSNAGALLLSSVDEVDEGWMNISSSNVLAGDDDFHPSQMTEGYLLGLQSVLDMDDIKMCPSNSNPNYNYNLNSDLMFDINNSYPLSEDTENDAGAMNNNNNAELGFGFESFQPPKDSHASIIPLRIRGQDPSELTDNAILCSEYLTFELEKESEAIEVMKNKLRAENILLHEIPKLNLSELYMIEDILTRLAEASLAWTNQSLVLQIACDVLKNISEIPKLLAAYSHQNEARLQCIEYQASLIDIGNTSSMNNTEIWQNIVWSNADFISQEKFDVTVMKQNFIHDNRPRNLWIDLKHKTLTIHDPTIKGQNKINRVLDERLIKQFNYTVNEKPGIDAISVTFWPKKIGSGQKTFNALVSPYIGHRFVALMKTFIAPERVPRSFKFGHSEGPFQQFKNLEHLPNPFPTNFLINLLQQKYVELSLMEKWCWAVSDSSSWMTDSLIKESAKLGERRRSQYITLLKSFVSFLRFEGYELISLLPMLSNSTSVKMTPNQSMTHKTIRVRTVRTNWLDSKIEQLSVPHMVCALVPSLAEYLHDTWMEHLKDEKWHYSEHHTFKRRMSPWCTSWTYLSPTGKNVRRHQAVILIKGCMTAGMILKPLDTRIRKNK